MENNPSRAQPEILMVEDSPVEAEMLRRILVRASYLVTLAKNGEEGLQALREHPSALVISDVQMPLMNGYELCRAIKLDEKLWSTPVILVTMLSEPKDIIKALEVGADSYITKPYVEAILLGRIGSLLDNPFRRKLAEERRKIQLEYGGDKFNVAVGGQRMANLLLSVYENSLILNHELMRIQNQLNLLNDSLDEKVRERTAELRQLLDRTVAAIALTLEKRDPHAAGHQQRVAKLATTIATEMRLSPQQVDGIHLCALLHNIGMVAVPAEIINHPGKLTELLFSFVKLHSQTGFDILKDIPFPWPVAQMVLQHHERLNGSGYPQGLKGEQIILEARILAVADVLEAMMAYRPYRAALGMDAALDTLAQGRGIQYDPAVVDACLRVVKQPGYAIAG